MVLSPMRGEPNLKARRPLVITSLVQAVLAIGSAAGPHARTTNSSAMVAQRWQAQGLELAATSLSYSAGAAAATRPGWPGVI